MRGWGKKLWGRVMTAATKNFYWGYSLKIEGRIFSQGECLQSPYLYCWYHTMIAVSILLLTPFFISIYIISYIFNKINHLPLILLSCLYGGTVFKFMFSCSFFTSFNKALKIEQFPSSVKNLCNPL